MSDRVSCVAVLAREFAPSLAFPQTQSVFSLGYGEDDDKVGDVLTVPLGAGRLVSAVDEVSGDAVGFSVCPTRTLSSLSGVLSASLASSPRDARGHEERDTKTALGEHTHGLPGESDSKPSRGRACLRAGRVSGRVRMRCHVGGFRRLHPRVTRSVSWRGSRPQSKSLPAEHLRTPRAQVVRKD